MDPILDLEIVRTAEGGYCCDWQGAWARAPVTIHGGPTPATIDFSAPLTRGVRHGIEIPGLPVPWYFAVQTGDCAPLIAGARHFALGGAINFRDLGGYATTSGRRLHWGRLYRSGHLSRLDEAARAEIAALGIRTVCDFRLPEERATENAVLPHAPRLETIGIPAGLNDQHFFHRLFASTDDPALVVAEIETILRVFVVEFADRYRRMFDLLLNAEPGALLFNCSAGKERTGVGMVLLLWALGVPRETVRHDFLLSRRYFPAALELDRVLVKYAVPGKDPAVLRALVQPLLDTPDSYIDTVLTAIDGEILRHGSEAAFFAAAYGLDADARRHLQETYTV